jgi:hypothetical protein
MTRGRAVKAIVDVAWYGEYSGKWTTRSQLVRWYLAFDGTVQSENRIWLLVHTGVFRRAEFSVRRPRPECRGAQ